MEGSKNYGIVLLEQANAHLESFKGKKTYNKKQHEDIKTALYFLKKSLMVNRLVIEVNCSEEELNNIVSSQYITLKGKTYSVLHEEVVTLQINKGKGQLTITEVEVIDEVKELKKV